MNYFSKTIFKGGDYTYFGEIEGEDEGWEDIGTDYSDDGGDQGESGLQNVSFVPFLAFTLVKKLVLNCFFGQNFEQICNLVRQSERDAPWLHVHVCA